jgi:hypothetical protein
MQILIKALISVAIILAATAVGRKHLSLPFTLVSSFGVWSAAAVVHQWILK